VLRISGTEESDNRGHYGVCADVFGFDVLCRYFAERGELMSKPITPEEALKQKVSTIPDAVFEAFNTLIVRDYDGKQATVKQREVIKLYETNTGEKFTDIHWLNVENLYRDSGWEVFYEKPGYNESYEPYFIFRSDIRCVSMHTKFGAPGVGIFYF
jgi:hypothetical protein